MGRVQTRAYANMSFIITSVIEHYADEQITEAKKRTRFALVMSHEHYNMRFEAGNCVNMN